MTAAIETVVTQAMRTTLAGTASTKTENNKHTSIASKSLAPRMR